MLGLRLIRRASIDGRGRHCDCEKYTFASAHCRAGGVLLIGIFTGPSYLRNSPPQQSCQRRLSVAQSVSSQATHCTAYTCTRPLVRSHPVAVVAAVKGHPSSTQSRACTVTGNTIPTHQTQVISRIRLECPRWTPRTEVFTHRPQSGGHKRSLRTPGCQQRSGRRHRLACAPLRTSPKRTAAKARPDYGGSSRHCWRSSTFSR